MKAAVTILLFVYAIPGLLVGDVAGGSPQARNNIAVVVNPLQSSLLGADALTTDSPEVLPGDLDLAALVMPIVQRLDDDSNWVIQSIQQQSFARPADSGRSAALNTATRVLHDLGDDVDGAMLLDFLFFVSPDHDRVRVVAGLRTYALRYGRYTAIAKLTRRYEYLSPVLDSISDDAIETAASSVGRMIRADLRVLLTSTAYPDERASFTGLDPSGQRWGFRGRLFFADGRNTVYRDADGNLYSVPTAD